MEKLYKEFKEACIEFSLEYGSGVNEVNMYLNSKYKDILSKENEFIRYNKLSENKYQALNGTIANIFYNDNYSIKIELVN